MDLFKVRRVYWAMCAWGICGGEVWSITRFKPDVKVVYGELQGCRCSIVVAPRGLVAIIATHIAALVELL